MVEVYDGDDLRVHDRGQGIHPVSGDVLVRDLVRSLLRVRTSAVEIDRAAS